MGTGALIEALDEAAGLYRDGFLAGFTLRDSPGFDEWQLLQAESLRRQLAEALQALVEAHSAAGQWDAAIARAQRWLALDPLDEAPQRALMQLYAWTGRRNLAIHQYEACQRLLHDELDAEPEAETSELYEQIRTGCIGPRPDQARLTSSGLQPDAMLPADPTPFVGRAEELAQIARLLADPGCRLLTLVGSGGIGKTRLAIQAATLQGKSFPQGSVFVPLEAVSSGDEVAGAIVEKLRLPSVRGNAPPTMADEAARLLAHLQGRTMLLVLDNMDHLLAAAPLLSQMVARAPGLKLLITSREPLNLSVEWVFEVPPLSYPGPGRTGDLEGYQAVQLFLRSAQRARAGITWQPADWPAIVRICQLVEGMPLGIELAAAWVRALSCSEIAAELERNADLPPSARRGTPERHRSLRAVFEQSWGLLEQPDRLALAQLSAFQGGFTRDAAAQVAAATIETLSTLMDKSLLSRSPSGRYHLHQLLQQHAAEKLAAMPHAKVEARARHCAYYLQLLRKAGEQLMGREEEEALERLRAEAGNLRLAWHEALAAGELATIRTILPAWVLYHEMSGRRREGVEAVRPAVAAARAAYEGQPDDPTIAALLAFLLAVQRHFSDGLAPPGEVKALMQESLALARTLPGSLEKAFTLLLSSVQSAQGVEETLAFCRESQGIFEAVGHRWGAATARLVWGDCANMAARDYEAAAEAYETSLAAFRQLGNRWGEALCLTGLSIIAQQRSQHTEVIALQRQSLATYQAARDSFRTCHTLQQLAEAAAALGDVASARAYYEESVAWQQEAGYRTALPYTLARLGELARRQSDLPAARSYLERCLALSDELGNQELAASALAILRDLPGAP